MCNTFHNNREKLEFLRKTRSQIELIFFGVTQKQTIVNT